MASASFQSTFNTWLDNALAYPIPSGVIAFSFNLSEPWCIEVIGSDRFSADDSDWACEESFRPDVKNLRLSDSEVGSNWEAVLEEAKKIVLQYIYRPSTGSKILRGAAAVSVGCVDGELLKIWPK